MGVIPATIFLIFNFFGILLAKYYQEKIIFDLTAGVLSICFIVFLVRIFFFFLNFY